MRDLQWIECNRGELTAGVVVANGIGYQYVEDEFDSALDKVASDNGYIQRDMVALNSSTDGLDPLLQKFFEEHRHDEDEVRFVVEGEGTFDIRDADNSTDGWMRVTVEKGDLVVVPAGRYHRFALTESQDIKAVRLFKRAEGWKAEFRQVELPFS